MSEFNEHIVRQHYITRKQDHLAKEIICLERQLDENKRELRQLGKDYLQSVADYEAEQAWAKYDPEGTLKPLVEFVAARLESAPSICKGERRWRTRNALEHIARGQFPESWTNQFDEDGNLAALHLHTTYVLTSVLQNDHAKGSIEFKNELWKLHNQLGHDNAQFYVNRKKEGGA